MGENQQVVNATTVIDELVTAGEVMPNLLRGDTVRGLLEYKNQLKNAGDIYVGTGETVTNNDGNKTVIYRTKGTNIIDAINEYGGETKNTHVEYAEKAYKADNAVTAGSANSAANASKVLAYNVSESNYYTFEIRYGTTTPSEGDMKDKIYFVVEE